MGNGFREKICVITGGASGIGRALAAELVRRGAVVVIGDIDGARAEAVAAELGGNCAASRTDVAQAESVRALIDGVVATHGRIDYLFNNAGIAVVAEIRDTSLA